MDQQGVRALFDLTGRVAIVTGGTRGIGRAIAGGFVAAGAKVAVASRKADACAATEKQLIDAGGNTGPESMAGMAAASLQKRIADADKMVGPALFLASDAASFITGQVIKADGGLVPG